MAPLLKGLLGNGNKDRETAEELRSVLREMQEERTRFEGLLEAASASANRLRLLGEPIGKIENDLKGIAARLGDLEKQLAATSKVATQVDALGERTERMSKQQTEAEAELARALSEAQQIRDSFDGIRERVEQANALQDRLGSFLELEKPFEHMQASAETLRGQVDGTADQIGRLREQHDRLVDAHKLAMSKMEALDRRREEFSRDLQDKERRITTVEQSVRGMDGVRQTVDDVRREIGALKSLGDNVAQRSAALEAQREAVERALSRADDLDRSMRQIDAGVRQLQENEARLGTLGEDVNGLRALHEAVLERSREIAQLQREADEQTGATRQDLAAARDEMKRTLQRFDFESHGLESFSQRVGDLRGELADFETRFGGLRESSRTVSELDAQTSAIANRLQAHGVEVQHLDEEMAQLRVMRRDLEASRESARALGAQLARIEFSRESIDAARGQIDQLSGAHALVQDAREQMQLAHEEIARSRELQSETRTWLVDVKQTLESVQAQASQVVQLAPTVDHVSREAQRVDAAQASIESRRAFVEALHQRLAQIGGASDGLDERTRHLQARMDAAEQRFVVFADHATEAEALTQTIGQVTAAVHEAERGSQAAREQVAHAASRCESVEQLAERTRSMKQELDQRQQSLDEAVAALERATGMRKQAATAAQQLEALSGRLTEALGSAQERLSQAGTLSTELEGRAGVLESVQRRLDQFEGRLAKWERVDQQVTRSLDQIAARAGTVETLRGDLERMSAMAEKTSADVHAIATAQGEIEASRAQLTDVLEQLQRLHETESTLEERKRQMAKAEERMARAEALLADVRSSLEALEGQKALVDHALEKAGSLQFLLKQADAAIETLRAEQKMTSRVRSAVALVRDGDDEDGEVAKAA